MLIHIIRPICWVKKKRIIWSKCVWITAYVFVYTKGEFFVVEFFPWLFDSKKTWFSNTLELIFWFESIRPFNEEQLLQYSKYKSVQPNRERIICISLLVAFVHLYNMCSLNGPNECEVIFQLQLCSYQFHSNSFGWNERYEWINVSTLRTKISNIEINYHLIINWFRNKNVRNLSENKAFFALI